MGPGNFNPTTTIVILHDEQNPVAQFEKAKPIRSSKFEGQTQGCNYLQLILQLWKTQAYN